MQKGNLQSTRLEKITTYQNPWSLEFMVNRQDSIHWLVYLVPETRCEKNVTF